MKKTYNASDIEVYEGLEAVRKRPGMYIGGVDFQALHHLVFEVLDNAIDECSAGFATKIALIVDKDGITVADNGRGIPIDINLKYGVNALELLLTKLHSGAKFNNSNYNFSSGLHGVGLSVVNALSIFTNILVKKKEIYYMQKFSRGNPISSLQVVEKPEKNFAFIENSGTVIHFMPDEKIFNEIIWQKDILFNRLNVYSNLNSHLNIDFVFFGQKIIFSNGCLSNLMPKLNNYLLSKHFHIKINKENEYEYEIMLNFSSNYDEKIFSFANNIATVNGGKHVKIFKLAWNKLWNTFFENVKQKNVNCFRFGLVVVIACKINEPMFAGQVKSRLVSILPKALSEDILNIIYKQIVEDVHVFKICKQKIEKNFKYYGQLKKISNLSTSEQQKINWMLPAKLSDCFSRDVEENEVSFVEGSSAGGNAVVARNSAFQAILTLKGKLINVSKANINKVLKNEEIQSIAAALGIKFFDDVDISKLRYGKIIIMADADPDGQHIRVLHLNFFFVFFPLLLKMGKIFVSVPPLYGIKNIRSGKIVQYCYDNLELEEKLNILKKQDNISNYDIKYFKGLGEMSADELLNSTLDPAKRRIKRIVMKDNGDLETMKSLMGDDVIFRKNLVENNFSNKYFTLVSFK